MVPQFPCLSPLVFFPFGHPQPFIEQSARPLCSSVMPLSPHHLVLPSITFVLTSVCTLTHVPIGALPQYSLYCLPTFLSHYSLLCPVSYALMFIRLHEASG